MCSLELRGRDSDNRERSNIYKMSLTDTEITVKLSVDGAEGLFITLITNKNLFS